MKKLTNPLQICAACASLLLIMMFSSYTPREDSAASLRDELLRHYDPGNAGGPVTKFELIVTPGGFCRYKRFLRNGMIEYFSFNLQKFKELLYLGSVGSGTLLLKTRGEDVIVQTYNSRRGDDIDSMANVLPIPFKNIQAEELNDLSDRFAALARRSP